MEINKMHREELAARAKALRERASVIEAWLEGKKIQLRERLKDHWTDLLMPCPSFEDKSTEYRIKPEPREVILYDCTDRGLSFLKFEGAVARKFREVV